MPPRVVSEALTPDADSVARFGADLGALAPDGPVLIAVSGGADSVALLLLMHGLAPGRCIAATVDHGLRGDSAAEAAWVAALCARIGVAHATLAAPMPDRAGRTLNLQARARALRYRMLKAHGDTVGARWLATAHHADDQLETMVMRLNRGAGVAGLAGVRRRIGRVVRPLLGWRRAELDAIVAAAGIAAIADPSNRDDRFDRARLRKALRDAPWLDAGRWTLSAAALGEAEAALAWATDRRAARCMDLSEDGTVTLAIGDEPPEIVRRLVARCLAAIDPTLQARGPALGRLVAAIRDRRRATLGHVLIVPMRPADHRLRVRFTLAPPRRSG